MTSEQPPRDALRPLRPLPSIDIPLLREERSAVRSRRFVRLALVLGTLLACGVLAAGFLLPEGSPEPSEAPAMEDVHGIAGAYPEPDAFPPEPEALAPEASKKPAAAPSLPIDAGPPVDPRATVRTQHLFGRYGSFSEALEKNGLSRSETQALINALGAVMDFRRSLPDDVLTVERAAEGVLIRFEYRSGLTQRYEAVRTEQGGFEARQVQVPIRQVRVARGGSVVGSLGDSLDGLKIGRSMTGVFTEVFDGQISFSTDTRAGDTFRIIFDEDYVEDRFLRYGTVYALEYRGGKAGHLTAFWYESKNVEGDFFDETGRALHGGWLRTPLRYDHISSPYGMRFHPVLKRKRLHNGIDYAASTGTPVRAAAAGVVTFAGPKGPNGNLLAIAHTQGYETFYAHLSRFAPGIKRGTKVKQRQLIAYVGSTGRSTGPHLHFSLKRHGRFLDPESQLNGPGLPLPPKELPQFKKRVRELTRALANTPIEQPAPVVSPTPVPSPTDELGEEEL